MKRKLIIHADDLGLSYSANEGILKASINGVLTSASVVTNGEAFLDAVERVIPQIPQISLGVHLNLFEGKPLSEYAQAFWIDEKNEFLKSFLKIFILSHNSNAVSAAQKEWDMQIQKALDNKLKINHLDSHLHIHFMPKLFPVICQLATKYKITYIRNPNEKYAFIFPKINRMKSFFLNQLKKGVLNYWNYGASKTLSRFQLKTNAQFLGLNFTNIWTKELAIRSLNKQNSELTEILFHPGEPTHKDKNTYAIDPQRKIELEILLSSEFKNFVNENFELTNYHRENTL